MGDLPSPPPATNGADEHMPRPKTGKGSGKGRKPGQRITTEAEKAKTSATMKGRGLSQEHKKNLMTVKCCSHCKEPGHNALGCPKLHPEKLQNQLHQASRGLPQTLQVSRASSTCKVCGKKGHNRWQCPMFTKQKLERQARRHGALWGLPGVQEQRLPGKQQRVLAWPMPLTTEIALQQATAAVARAQKAGIWQQRLQLNMQSGSAGTGQNSGLSTVQLHARAQAAVSSFAELMLKQLQQQQAFQGRMQVKRTGDTDHATAWQNENLVAVTFPTAATFAQQRRLAQASNPERLLIVITSHSETGHQVASRALMARRSPSPQVLAGLQYVYCLEHISLSGDQVCLFKCHPGDWQVHYSMPSSKTYRLIGIEKARPSDARLIELLMNVPDTQASSTWDDKQKHSKDKVEMRVESESGTAHSAAGAKEPKQLSLRERLAQRARVEQQKP